jgi:hypothetical protein
MIIYINGYWNRITGFLGISPGTPDEDYWNHFSPLFISASCEFMEVAPDETKLFIDGSSLFGIDQLAGERYQKGLKYALDHLKALKDKSGGSEPIKIISHSEGCAFAAGIADFLLSHNCNVEKMLYLSPREGADFISPPGPFSIQAHYSNDPVCFPKRIRGVTVFINLFKLDGKKAGLRYAHGGTVKASTLKKVQKVLNMLPHDPETNQIEGVWTITETSKGYDFKREADFITI